MSGGRATSVGLGVAARGVRKVVRDPTRALSPLSTPLLSFVAFTGALSALASTRGFGYYDYTVFEFVFVLVSATMMAGVFTAIEIAADFEGGLGSRLLLAAPRRLAILGGYVLLGLIRAVLAAAVLWGVALAIGMNVRGDVLDVVALTGLALLLNVVATLYGAGVALRLRSQAAGGLILLPVYAALFLSPMIAPRDELGSWLKDVARVNPLTAVLESGRGFLAGDPVRVVPAFAAVAGLVLAGAAWAALGMRSAERGSGGGRRRRRRRAAHAGAAAGT